MKTEWSPSALERLGGKEKLYDIIQDFIRRVYADPIIGFFFLQIDQKRLIQREYEFATNHLGGHITYTGRSIAQSHQKHPINKGHFHRRIWLLDMVLQEHDVPDDIRESWIQHNKQLESVVTDGTDCQEASS